MNNLKIERDGRVVTVRLHRPHVLNALSRELMAELLDVLGPLDRDPEVGCFVITGSEKVFAAGADIREMAGKSAVDMVAEDYFAGWEDFAALRTPKIAAVTGYALGGGCELAMMCDLVIAAETAPLRPAGDQAGRDPRHRRHPAADPPGRPGQGDGPGPHRPHDGRPGGRTLRPGLPRGPRRPGPRRGPASGHGHRLVRPPAVRAARECVDRALETGLRDGILFERRVFHALFATEDQKEGMTAFLEKRTARFHGR